MTVTNFVAALVRMEIKIIGTNNDHHPEWLFSAAHDLKDAIMDLVKVNGLWSITADGKHFAYAQFC